MNTKIIVVGVGALGSHVVQFLRNQDSSIRIVDFDRVEQRNVGSQFHGKPNVGKAKVASLQQTMNFLFGRKIETTPHKLTADNVGVLLKGSDLIIDCLDNALGRRLIQQYVRAAPVAIDMKVDTATGKGVGKSVMLPCLHGALDANGSFGRVVWDSNFVPDEEGAPGAATCENGEHLPFIAIVAAHIAYAAQLFLKDGRQVGFEISPGGAIRT